MEAILGCVFLAGAFLKVATINTFAVQIWAYGVYEDKAWLPVSALATLFVETGLGAALLLGLRLRMFTFAALEALLLVFTGLILYGWVYHNLAECACFGTLEMSPGISIAKNVVLLVLGGMAWAGAVMKGECRSAGRAVVAKLAAVLVLSSALVVYASTALDPIVDPAIRPTDGSGGEGRPFARFVIETEMGSYDLGHGEYLVIMLSATCEHCMSEIPFVNDLLLMPGVPTAVALCLEESEGTLEEFKRDTNPAFPLYSLGDQALLYFSLIGEDTFRIYYTRDGRPIRYWDTHPPTYDDVMEAMGPPTSAAA